MDINKLINSGEITTSEIIVRKIISEFRPDTRETFLHLAVLQKHKEMINLLIDYEADINVEDYHDKTPLHDAISLRFIKIINLLIRNGADVNAKNLDCDTPLHIAAALGHADMSGLLIAERAEIDSINNDGYTPLNYANAQGREEVADLLRGEGAGVKGKYKNVDILLVSNGADIDFENLDAQTPLDIAISKKNREMINILTSGSEVLQKKRKFEADSNALDLSVKRRTQLSSVEINHPGYSKGPVR